MSLFPSTAFVVATDRIRDNYGLIIWLLWLLKRGW